MNFLRKLLGFKPRYTLKTPSYKKFHQTQHRFIVDDNAPKIAIITKPQTYYFACLLAYKFHQHGMNSMISPYDFDDDTITQKIIFCPQTYDDLPRGYIGYQTEQTTNDRFFKADHIDRLNNASVLIDYALDNINFLKSTLDNHIDYHHLPVSYIPNYPEFLQNHGLSIHHADRPYDVVFYGDPRNERRQAYLAELQKHFNVKIICGVFGVDVTQELLKSKIIVNIHYFDDAILEIGRIYEAMSLGCHIISEKAIDQHNHPHLDGLVDFCAIDDINDMVAKVRHALDNDDYRHQMFEKIQSANLSKTLDDNFAKFIKIAKTT